MGRMMNSWGGLDLVVLPCLTLPYPASAGEGVPGEWRDMGKTCFKVELPASLLACSCQLGGEAGGADLAKRGQGEADTAAPASTSFISRSTCKALTQQQQLLFR